jgi:hypothetical protein
MTRWPFLLLIGVLVGVVVGYAMQRLPMKPILQTMGAALISWALASVAGLVLWLSRPPRDVGVLAVSFGVGETLVAALVVLVVAAAIHAGLGWASSQSNPAMLTYRPIIVGVLAGVATAFLQEVGLAMGRPFR